MKYTVLGSWHAAFAFAVAALEGEHVLAEDALARDCWLEVLEAASPEQALVDGVEQHILGVFGADPPEDEL